MPARLKKGDLVLILSGKDKGKKEKVLKVFPQERKVLVERVNVVKRHLRPSQKFQGGIVERLLPVSDSKVMLVCPHCNRATRIKIKVTGDTGRVRICSRCKEMIS